ncbi:flagellar protein FlgN [Thermolongibacillus altinsuensis]
MLELIQLLEKQVKLHKGLCKLAHEKTEAIKTSDLTKLQTIMNDEQKYVMAIRQLEAQRMNMLSVFPEEERTIQHCAERMQEQERKKLLTLVDELSETIQKLKQINELNTELIHQSLQFIHLTLDLMLPQEQPVTYTPHREEDQPLRSSFEAKT